MALVIIPCGESDWLIQTEQAQLLNWNGTRGGGTMAALTGGDTSGGDSGTAGARLTRLQMIHRPRWSSLASTLCLSQPLRCVLPASPFQCHGRVAGLQMLRVRAAFMIGWSI